MLSDMRLEAPARKTANPDAGWLSPFRETGFDVLDYRELRAPSLWAGRGGRTQSDNVTVPSAPAPAEPVTPTGPSAPDAAAVPVGHPGASPFTSA